MTPEERFWAKVDKTETCWLWTGYRMPNGYGVAPKRPEGGSRLAHRISYELLVGPIPAGLVLDHLCRVRNCVNPSHLEPVTMRENLRRGEAIKARKLRKERQTHCKQGHPYDEENTLYHANGWRRCKACMRAYDHAVTIPRRKARRLQQEAS